MLELRTESNHSALDYSPSTEDYLFISYSLLFMRLYYEYFTAIKRLAFNRYTRRMINQLAMLYSNFVILIIKNNSVFHRGLTT